MNHSHEMLLGERVKHARKAKRLSQEELAKSIGMSQAGLSKLEMSLTATRTKFASEISEATGASLEWIISGKGQMINSSSSATDKSGINKRVLSKAIQAVELAIQKKSYNIGEDEKANIIGTVYDEIFNGEDVSDREINMLLRAIHPDE